MNRKLHQLVRAAVCGAALAALPAAQATVLDFESVAAGEVGHLQTFQHGGYDLMGYSNAVDALPGDAVGMVADGLDPGTCANLMCPANDGHYYQGLNDGVLVITASTPHQQFRLSSLDASFIGSTPGATYPAQAGILSVYGVFADGTSANEQYRLDGPGANGFQFGHFLTSKGFASQQFVEVDIFAYSCDANVKCVAFTDNKGQFALDNVAVTAVPEPSNWLMLGLGLLGMGALARRRHA